jgi:hypothetical protein
MLMSKVLDEGNLRFDFSAFTYVERFDDEQNNPNGLKSVDFVLEDTEVMYFIEVKDFQNPKAPEERKELDFNMLTKNDEKRLMFSIEMGAKIKDSLLQKYALGQKFIKKVCYLLFINLDKLSARDRGRLKEQIKGYIPTGLGDKKYNNFSKITFDLVNKDQLKTHNISCSVKQ